VRKLLSRHLDQPCLPAGLDDYVHQHSEGNPLFAIAILEHLIAQEYLVREAENGAATWNQRSPFPELETTVPDPLAQMIELEIERLNQKDQRLLAAASLMSIAFPAWAVAAALDEDAADVEEACDELARRLYFVRRAGEDELPDGTRSAFYVFAHAMYREVLYQRQGVGRRARQHTRIAGRLAELFAGREASVAREIAQHYEAAGQWQPAMAALHAAGRHALERHAFAEAASLLDHALRLVTNLRESERRSVAEQIRGDLAVAREAMTPAASIGFQKLDAFWTGT
jgi:predicted ATPase